MPRRPNIPKRLRRLVIARAQGYCEYCLLQQDFRPEPHHLDHIRSVKHGGATVSENLAQVCAICNWAKGTDLAAIDPLSQELTFLFNPRQQIWTEHFSLAGSQIVGLTATGRATVELLKLNDENRLLDRQELMAVGLYPPAWAR